MTEAQYQAKLIRKLGEIFPGCIVQKMDTQYQQGFPDLILLWQHNWAALEVKKEPPAVVQPNQRYFIERLGDMSYAAFVYPENEEEVLSALQQAFEPPRGACIPQS